MTIKAWKLFRIRKNNTIGPLFINRKQIIPLNKWLIAEEYLTFGFKFRPGWHATNKVQEYINTLTKEQKLKFKESSKEIQLATIKQIIDKDNYETKN